MDKHLIEGRLIHLLLLEPDRFDEEFVMTPLKMPTDSVKKILRIVSNRIVDPNNYISLAELDDQILEALKEEGLYQSFKEDQKRLDKIITIESETYFKFLQTTGKTIVDADTFARCMDRVHLIRANDEVTKLLMQEATDFEMDTLEVYNEHKMEAKLTDFKFGIKGSIDKLIIDNEKKTATIIDLKTSGKSLENFAESVDYFNYWLQAAVYCLLVAKNFKENQDNYKIIFKFVVIDKYDQVYVFPVQEGTIMKWTQGLADTLQRANYHYSERKYDLPYDFANRNVTL